MKEQFRFIGDGILQENPCMVELPSGKTIAELMLSTCNYKGEERRYRIRVTDAEDAQGLQADMRLRVEGIVYSREGKKADAYGNYPIFYDMYADNVIPYYEVKQEPQPQAQDVRGRERQVYGRPQPQNAPQSPQDAPQGYQRSGNSYSYGNRQQGGYRQQQEKEDDIPF